MFPGMRRKDRELNEEDALALLKTAIQKPVTDKLQAFKVQFLLYQFLGC